MRELKDFRNYSYSYEQILACGKYLGRGWYWKLYAIENTIRIIIHSILSVQWNETPDWWISLAGEAKKNAQKNINRYLPTETRIFSRPGKHPIYFIDIKDLNEIIRVNSAYFLKIIPNLDKFMLDIENIRIPRNIIAHMNFPNRTDLNRINVFYDDLQIILDIIKEKKIELKIP